MSDKYSFLIRTKIYFFYNLTKLSPKIFIFFRALLKILTGPFSTFFVTLSQLVLGAILGSKVPEFIEHAQNNTLPTMQFIRCEWQNLPSLYQFILIAVLAISVMKSILDSVDANYEKKVE